MKLENLAMTKGLNARSNVSLINLLDTKFWKKILFLSEPFIFTNKRFSFKKFNGGVQSLRK